MTIKNLFSINYVVCRNDISLDQVSVENLKDYLLGFGIMCRTELLKKY